MWIEWFLGVIIGLIVILIIGIFVVDKGYIE